MIALGCRVKSGRAIVVALAAELSAPAALFRRELMLCDPAAAATRQPYHSARGEAETNERLIAERVAIIERCAARAVDDLLRRMDATPTRACLVVGSVVDPQRIGNQHMRAHANEGRIFRVVLDQALSAHGIAHETVVDKMLKATPPLSPPRTLEATLVAFGKTLGTPWTADEKLAALGALRMLRVPS